ncbi:MAG: hypothetical protein WKF88_00935 [Ferruginibacter sp.]
MIFGFAWISAKGIGKANLVSFAGNVCHAALSTSPARIFRSMENPFFSNHKPNPSKHNSL